MGRFKGSNGTFYLCGVMYLMQAFNLFLCMCIVTTCLFFFHAFLQRGQLSHYHATLQRGRYSHYHATLQRGQQSHYPTMLLCRGDIGVTTMRFCRGDSRVTTLPRYSVEGTVVTTLPCYSVKGTLKYLPCYSVEGTAESLPCYSGQGTVESLPCYSVLYVTTMHLYRKDTRTITLLLHLCKGKSRSNHCFQNFTAKLRGDFDWPVRLSLPGFEASLSLA